MQINPQSLKQAQFLIQKKLKPSVKQSALSNYCVMLEGHGHFVILPLLIEAFKIKQSNDLNNKKIHLMLIDTEGLVATVWDQIASVYQQLFGDQYQNTIVELKKYWPLVLPGIQRFDGEHYSVTLAHHTNSYKMQRQWVAEVSFYWRQNFLFTDTYLNGTDWNLFLQKAAPHCEIFSTLDQPQKLLAICRSSGLQIKTQDSFLDGMFVVAHRYDSASNRFENSFNSLQNKAVLKHKERKVSKDISGQALRSAMASKPSIASQANQANFNHLKTIAVIGGGIAGAGIAHQMALRGWQVTVFDPAFAKQASPHQGHLAAAMTPYISADDNYKSRLSRAGVLRAHARWQHFSNTTILSRAGSVELKRQQGYGQSLIEMAQKNTFPTAWLQPLTAQQASELTGMSLKEGGVFWPYGWQISPQNLIKNLLNSELIQCQPAQVEHLFKTHSQIRLYTASHQDLGVFDQVVLAMSDQTLAFLEKNQLHERLSKAGKRVHALEKASQSLHIQGGEIMYVPASSIEQRPQRILGGQGYFLPAVDGVCVLGSTYRRAQKKPIISKKAQQEILSKMPVPIKLKHDSVYPGWSGYRSVVHDRMPVIGRLTSHPNIWLSFAYGSHGLTWSSLAGEIIACFLEGEPLPIEKDLLGAIDLR